MLPNDFFEITKAVEHRNNRTLKELFKGYIKGSFLIDIKYRVIEELGEKLLTLYDFSLQRHINDLVTPKDTNAEYDICKHIVGVHRANTIFLKSEERIQKEKDEKYKSQLINQVVEQISLRAYGSAYFREKKIVLGDQFNYYPVPYELFVLCMRMHSICYQKGAIGDSAYYFAKIINKAMSALTLLEDGFLSTAYLPCRTALELYVKLLVLRNFPELFEEDRKFSYYETIQTCYEQEFPDEFNQLFANRINKKEKNKIEYLHYGFVDNISDYHDIVKKKPYSFNGLLKYLKAISSSDILGVFNTIEMLHKMCHGYVHGGISESKYPLLHYFEITLMLYYVIPTTYMMFCTDYNEETCISGIDILEKIQSDSALLINQYDNRSTENFEIKN